MLQRVLTACVGILFAAASVHAQPPKPAIVVQAKPVSRLLADLREGVRQVAGPAEAEKAIKELNENIKRTLGEQGFEGLDTNRPIGAYVVLRDEIQDTSAVLVVPVTGEKEFVGLLERMKMKVEAVQDKKGVYKLSPPGGNDPLPKGVHLQFAGPWAYVSFNEEGTDSKNLVAAGDLFDNADESLFVAKLYPERVPQKLIKSALDQLDTAAGGIKGLLGGGGVPPHIGRLATTFFEEGPKLVHRYVETGHKEAAELAVRLTWDSSNGEVSAELAITPKPGTDLAKDIAANAVITNRFAGLVPKDIAVGAIFKAPLYAEETRKIVAALLEAGQEQLKSEPGGFPKQFHPIVDEVAKGLIGSVKKGDFGGAMALVGPDKGGKFTIVGGLSLENAPAVEKAARDLVKGQDFAKIVELDAAKAGDVNIHKVSLLTVFPERDRAEFSKMFGENAPGYVAFASDAVFVALGSDALERIKAAIAAKPGPAPMLDIVGNMKRLHATIAATGGEREAGEFAKIMGTDDKLVSMLRVAVAGGDKLTVKGALNVRFLPRVAMSAKGEAREVRPAPPPPVIKR